MRILFLCSGMGSGGAERTVSYLSSFFSGKGHDVEIVNVSGKLFYEIDKKIVYTNLGVPTKNKGFFRKKAMACLRFVLVNKQIMHARPDVVCCILPEVAKYILLLHRIRKFVLITSERNNPEFDGNLKLKKRIFEQSEGVVFQTKRACDFYDYETQAKGRIIHNAVGNKLAYEVVADYSKNEKIAAVGRLCEQKDYPTLFKAFKIVLETHPTYQLEIFGDGPLRHSLEVLAQKLGIDSNISFLGASKDAIPKISEASCYVMSSKYEGMPNALMEAMAIGLPCVATDCPNGPLELIEDKYNGLLVPVGDPYKLADAINLMIDNRDFAKKCGENARRIIETHNIENIATCYLDYIESIVEKRT